MVISFNKKGCCGYIGGSNAELVKSFFDYEGYEKGASLKVVPHLLAEKTVVDLVEIFKGLVDRFKQVQTIENDHMIVRIMKKDKSGGLIYEGLFIGRLIKRDDVSKEDGATLTINESNVIKVKRILDGVKTVMEFRPATDKE